ncbi:MAG: 4-phosphoerythronate dehydrogenase [Bacteroidales bacterium]|nr:4-phosphoerythronate dehydrogenase [Bacteroidales bacterium]
MKIVIDDKIPFIKGVLEPYAEVVYKAGARTTAEDVADADAIITRTRTICNENLLKGSSVKAIATATIGFDHIDTAWCEANGTAWSNAPGCNSWSVKQYISAALAFLAEKHGLNLEGMALGVVGVGNVGSKVAEVGKALGMRVILNDPPRARKEGSAGFSDLDRIISECDIVTVHVPLQKEGEDATWHLFNEEMIGRMRPDQILINSSRGPVVDNKALKSALQRHLLKGAVLDVWEGEPDLDPELVSLLDLATPHIAGYSADGKANGTSMSIRYISQQLGLPLTEWSATGLPAPVQPLVFELDADGKSTQKTLSEAIFHSYDISKDCDALRNDLGAFEKLRGDYIVRREPSAFTVRLRNGSDDLARRLGMIGFKVEQI